jgi:pilus assembly protein Flp/PilA
MDAVFRTIVRLAADESGATAIEYSLLCSLIFLVVVSSAEAVANSTISMYDIIINAL